MTTSHINLYKLISSRWDLCTSVCLHKSIFCKCSIFSFSAKTPSYLAWFSRPTADVSHFKVLLARAISCFVPRDSFISRLDSTTGAESISLHVARTRLVMPPSRVVRFVETSVSGKRDWTTEGNVQEIKPARRVKQKRSSTHLPSLSSSSSSSSLLRRVQ